jgi:hypothetical protein
MVVVFADLLKPALVSPNRPVPRMIWRRHAVLAALLTAVLGLHTAGVRPAFAEENTVSRADSALPAPVLDAPMLALYLERLMMSESGGRDTARNPRSTAVGPFQFIETTFLDLVERHFATETQNLPPARILALRSDRAFATRAVTIFTLENAASLAAAGITPTLAHLRLAHLVGATGAIQLAKAPTTSPVIAILGARVIQANPFMVGMTAGDLVGWSARSLGGRLATDARLGGIPPNGAVMPPTVAIPIALKPAIVPRCNLNLASCRKWLALAERAASKPPVVARRPGRVR